MHRYRVLKDFPHPDRYQGMIVAGSEVMLTPRQARYRRLDSSIEPVTEAAEQLAKPPAEQPAQPAATGTGRKNKGVET